MISNYDFLIALQIAAFAVAFSDFWVMPDNILSKYGDWLHKQKENGRLWLAKPLGGCAFCFGTQIAFWRALIFDWQMDADWLWRMLSMCGLVTLLCAALSRLLARLL
jgi:hypothetical protein